MFCLSESISDLVNRAEANKVACLIGCEGVDFDSEDIFELMGIPFLQNFQLTFVWPNGFGSSCIDQRKHIFDHTPLGLDVVRQFSQCSPQTDHIVNQDIRATWLHIPFKRGTQSQTLHRVSAGRYTIMSATKKQMPRF